MRQVDGKDYIYLIWKEKESRRNYIVGQLSKNGCFEFSYGFEVQDAIERGFSPLISFEDINKTYTNTILFPVFSSRLPDRKRKNIDEILEKYEMNSFDEYELLKKSGARLPIDSLEFIDPILSSEEAYIVRKFYLAGTRHYLKCNGAECQRTPAVTVGDTLDLILEPNNSHDENAIKVYDKNSNIVGYIPRYYSESIYELFEKQFKYRCTVIEFNKDGKCNECIRVELVLHK